MVGRIACAFSLIIATSKIECRRRHVHQPRHFQRHRVERVDLHRSARFQVLQDRRPVRELHVGGDDAFGVDLQAGSPSPTLLPAASASMWREQSISAGSSCVARTADCVSTHIGPALRLNASFCQISSRILGASRHRQVGGAKRCGKRLDDAE